MAEVSFYTENEKYKKLKEKLEHEDKYLLTEIVSEAVQYGIDILASRMKKGD